MAGKSAAATTGIPGQIGIGDGQIAFVDQTELGGNKVDPLAALGFESPRALKIPPQRSPLSASTVSMLGESRD